MKCSNRVQNLKIYLDDFRKNDKKKTFIGYF